MNADQWYRTGAVAKMLGTSPHRIRALAQAGVIESRLENNFRYVPKREVERLQAEGLPPLPATAEFSDEESSDDEEAAPGTSAESARRSRNRHDDLYSEPSPELARSKEKVLKLEHSAAAQQLKREMRKTARAERDEEARARQEQAAHQWRNEYLRLVAHSVPSEVCADACGQVQRLLDSVPPGTDLHQRVAEIIDAVQRPIRERQQQERDHAAHVKRMEALIHSIRISNFSLQETADDRDDARERARAALEVLPAGSTEYQMRMAADLAIEPVRERIRRKEAEYEHKSRVQSALVSMHIPGANWGELQEARELAGDALATMPVGSSERQLRDKVTEAIRRVVERSARRVAEEDTKRKAETRKFEIQLFLYHLDNRIDDRLRELEQAEKLFVDDYWDRKGLAGKVEKKIEPLLRAEIERNPQLSDADLKNRIARLVDEHYREFCDDDDDEDDE